MSTSDAKPPPAGDDSPSVQGAWDFADRLISRIASSDWTWSKTCQVALLIVVLAAALATLAWAAQGWTGWAVGIAAGVSGASAGARTYLHLSRKRVPGAPREHGLPHPPMRVTR